MMNSNELLASIGTENRSGSGRASILSKVSGATRAGHYSGAIWAWNATLPCEKIEARVRGAYGRGPAEAPVAEKALATRSLRADAAAADVRYGCMLRRALS